MSRRNENLIDLSPIDRLAYWINERERIRSRRERGESPPWTDDPILAEWSFCNVRREDDRGTRWLKESWRDPHARDPHLWHAMLVARNVNWPDTLGEAGYPEPWSRRGRKFIASMRARQALRQKVFSPAYVISNNAQPVDKITVVGRMLDGAWNSGEPVRKGDALAVAYRKLASIYGVGSFLAGQVVADLKYTPLLKAASDWWDWCVPGNGSQRGLNRVRRYDVTKKWTDEAFIRSVAELRAELQRRAPIVSELCLQDLQNCLCEFDKWDRTLHGEGKPRRRYAASG